MKTVRTPESSRLIRCKCFDWSEYSVIGMFIPFKNGSGKRTGQSRFCIQSYDGTWIGSRDTWTDVEDWEYVDSPSDRAKESK